MASIFESNSNNIGNLLIGQEIGVRVTDAAGNSTIRNMEVGEIYPAGEILLKDSETEDTIVFQFNEEDSNKLKNGLVYKNIKPEDGISYEFVISSEGNSNESITRQVFNESLSQVIKSNS